SRGGWIEEARFVSRSIAGAIRAARGAHAAHTTRNVRLVCGRDRPGLLRPDVVDEREDLFELFRIIEDASRLGRRCELLAERLKAHRTVRALREARGRT